MDTSIIIMDTIIIVGFILSGICFVLAYLTAKDKIRITATRKWIGSKKDKNG